MCCTLPGAESSISAALSGTAKMFLEGCIAAPAYSYTSLVQLMCHTATACIQGVLLAPRHCAGKHKPVLALLLLHS